MELIVWLVLRILVAILLTDQDWPAIAESLAAAIAPAADEPETDSIVGDPTANGIASGTNSVGVLPAGVLQRPGFAAAPKSSGQGTPDPSDASTRTPTRVSSVTSPEPTPSPTVEPTERSAVGLLAGTRYNDSVLRWLPEVKAAKAESGVAVALLAGVIRVGSNGDPNFIAPSDVLGLLQVLPEELKENGVPEDLWHDPAVSVAAGARVLSDMHQVSSGWYSVVRLYAARWCGADDACREEYADAIYAWRDYYKALLTDPELGGLVELPESWTPPASAPHQASHLLPLDFPPGYRSATPTPTPTTITPTPTGTTEPQASPTTVPTESPATATTEPSPTEISATETPKPTEVPPTETPTPSPTETPTDTPTEVPTEVPPATTSEESPPAESSE